MFPCCYVCGCGQGKRGGNLYESRQDKSEIFLQTLLEAGSVFTLSVLGATAIGKLFSGVLQNVITGSETVTENLKVVLQIQDIGMLFLLGGAVILVALCCSILPILRANPKDILAKMEG